MRFAACVFFCVGCSSAPPAGAPDAGTDSPVVVDMPDAMDDAAVPFPAPHPPPPKVISYGGTVIASPKVVPIFFANDAMQTSLESFLSKLAASSYWGATTKEYGVGAISIDKSIDAGPAPASITDDDIKAWLATQSDGTHPGWPKADANTIFAIFYPSTTAIDVHGKKSCNYFDGYHLEGQAKDGTPLVYAVLSRCADLDGVTVAASHELIEASTDPHYDSGPAFASTDRDHFIWTLATAGEVGDMCDFEPQANQRLVGNFMVERIWSNIAAMAGHDPCVPALADPYFAAVGDFKESVAITSGSNKTTTKGIKVPVGETRTLDVDLFSDAPTDPFNVEAFDGTVLFGGSAELDLTLDAAMGQNGDVLHLTIKALKAGPYGGSMLVLRAKNGSTSHITLGFVAN